MWPRKTYIDICDRPSIAQNRQDSIQRALSPKSGEAPIDDYAKLKGPSLLKKTLGLQRHRHGLHVGTTSIFEPILTRLTPMSDAKDSQDTEFFRHVSEHETYNMRPDEGTAYYEDENEDLDAIEATVSPHGKALINLYFRIVHPSFPILHKKVFLEKYERTHREFSPPLLAAVYILALNYWSYSTELTRFKRPDVSALESLALRSLNYVIHRPKISTVEAGLLMLQRPDGDTWPLTAQMVAVGQDLGLHLDCSNWRIPGWERGLRKRLAWALYMQDTWASLIHGRPSHILNSNWGVRRLTEKDFPENAADEDDEEGSTEVEKGRLLFCHMVSLAEILSSILQNLYSIRAEQEIENATSDATRSVLAKAKPLQIKLREWYAQLPESLSMEDVKVRKLSSTGYLHLAYFALEITLHRRVVRTLSACNDPHLVDICRTAAKARLISAMGFTNRLRPEHLQSFWYFASKFNFALIGVFQSLLCATAQNKEEASFYISRLDEYRWTLRVSSKSAEFLEQSIVIIDRSAKDLRKICLEDSRYTQRDETIDAVGNAYSESSIDPNGDNDYEPLQDIQLTEEMMETLSAQYSNEAFDIPHDFSPTQNTDSSTWQWHDNEYMKSSSHIAAGRDLYESV